MIIMLIATCLLGLCAGSFIDALVWRLHEQQKREIAGKRPSVKLSILRGRSMCPHCQHQLGVMDLIPVISWLSLGGKCRYCGHPIGRQSPLVELLTAALFVLSYQIWPFGYTTIGIVRLVFWLLLITGFIALVVYDLRWMLLPDKIVYALFMLVAIQTLVVTIWERDWHILIISLLGLAILGGLFYLLFQMSRGRWIGGGDVKLGFVLGLLVGGPSMSILLLFLASTAGTIVTLPLLLTGKAKRTSRIPFGPFLLLATIIVQLFGTTLSEWYQHIFL